MLMSFRPRRRGAEVQRAGTQRGFTLVEFLVVVVLLGVVGGIVTTSLIRGMHSTERVDARVTALTDLQRTVERIGRELRAADPLVLPANADTFHDEVRADVYRDGARYRYRYYLVDAGDGSAELREDVTRYEGEEYDDVVESRDGLFIADVANLETGTPLFTYFVVDPDSGELRQPDCDDPGDSGCRDIHATATQIQMQVEKLLPEEPTVRLETVVNIRSTRFSTAEG